MDFTIPQFIMYILFGLAAAWGVFEVGRHNKHEETKETSDEQKKQHDEEVESRHKLDKNITEMRTETKTSFGFMNSSLEDLKKTVNATATHMNEIERTQMKHSLQIEEIRDSAKAANERLDKINAPSIWETRKDDGANQE